MTTDAGLLADARAVLIGVSAYADAGFPPIRAARNSAQVMDALLADPALCGWPSERITVITDPVSASDLAIQVAEVAEVTTGVLLLYYVGHGVLSARGELFLTVTSTRLNRPAITGLAWSTLADLFRTCPARVRLAILDCCFAGQAIEALGSGSDPGLADIAHVEGVYTLTATTRNHTAHVPPPERQEAACTSFTGELHDLIRAGIPGKPEMLTLGDIYPVLRQRLRAKGLPAPNQRGTDTAYRFPFTANAAARVGLPGNARADEPGASPADAGRAQAARLIDHAVLLAHLSSNEGLKLEALVRAAATLAATDPHRAERIARSITSESRQGSALESVVEALIPTDPDRAKLVARSIADDYSRECALGHIAEALATTDLDQAIQLIEWSITSDRPKASALGHIAAALATTDPGQARHIVQSITDTDARESALGHIAWVLAATDPDEAERVAREIADGFAQAFALGDIAEVVAPTDPDRAERIAQSTTSEYKEFVLCRVVQGLAGTDPDRAGRLIDDAERNAWAITSEEPKALALYYIADALATTDPGRAERIVQSITDEEFRASALHLLTQELAGTDPDRAERIAQSITGKGYWHSLETWRASALRHVAEALAATDPQRAERIAWSITDADARLFALGHIAAAVAGTDPDRAERIAMSVTGGTTEQDRSESSSSSWSITSERAKAWALGSVARALTSTDPDRAARLIAAAEQLALSATDEGARINALLDTAKAFSIGPAPHDGPPGDRASIVTFPTVNPPAEH
jgi:Caspase domain